MNYEKAAQALAEVGYAEYGYVTFSYTDGIYLACEAMVPWICEKVDPLNNEAQRQVLIQKLKICRSWDLNYNEWNVWSEEKPSLSFFHDSNYIEAENKCIEACLDDG